MNLHAELVPLALLTRYLACLNAANALACIAFVQYTVHQHVLILSTSHTVHRTPARTDFVYITQYTERQHVLILSTSHTVHRTHQHALILSTLHTVHRTSARTDFVYITYSTPARTDFVYITQYTEH